MSSAPSEIARGGGSAGLPYDYSGHTDCDSPLGVVVHQDDGSAVRLPVVDDGVQLYERKVGPTAITRRAEVTIPIEGLGDPNWTRYVNSFSTPEQTGPISEELRFDARGLTEDGTLPSETAPEPSIQTADVIGQPIDDNGQSVGEPAVLFRGYIAAVGSQEGANRARFRIYDPMKLLTGIEAGVSFQDVTATDVLEYVRDRYVEEQSVFTDVGVDTDGVTSRVLRDNFKRFETVRRLLNNEKIIGEVITFSTNRDTLGDVIAWLQERANARVWFQPSGERGISLVAVAEDTTEYDLTTDADTNFPYLIQNNALFEMRPFTSLKVKGKPGVTIELGPRTVNTPFGDRYPEATAVYPPLRERFGGELVQSTTENVTDTDDAERTARKQLKQALDEVSGGSMITTLAPVCHPFDRIRATPACAGVTADVDDLRYEVQETVHSVVPSDDNLPRTEVSVSMAINPDLIKTESTVKDTRTEGEPSSGDSLDEYNWGYGPGAP